MEIKEDFSTDLAPFKPYDLVIANLKVEYSGLTIADVNDKAGYAKVHAARMTIKNKRIEVDKVTKALTEVGVRRNKAIYAERNRIVDMLTPIEEDLQSKEDIIDAEKLRIKKEADERLDRLAQSRAEQLIAFGDLAPNYMDLKVLPEDAFQKLLADQKKLHEAETARLAEEKERERIAKEKAEKERVEREEQQKKIDADRRALEAQQKAFDEQKAEAARKIKEEEDKRNREAEIKRLADLKAKQLLEEAEQREKEKQERERKKAERLERVKPDRDKMIDLSNAIADIKLPEVKTDEFVACVGTIKSRLTVLREFINDAIKKSEE